MQQDNNKYLIFVDFKNVSYCTSPNYFFQKKYALIRHNSIFLDIFATI